MIMDSSCARSALETQDTQAQVTQSLETGLSSENLSGNPSLGRPSLGCLASGVMSCAACATTQYFQLLCCSCLSKDNTSIQTSQTMLTLCLALSALLRTTTAQFSSATFETNTATDSPFATITSVPTGVCFFDRFGRSTCGDVGTGSPLTYISPTATGTFCSYNIYGQYFCPRRPTPTIEGCYVDDEGALLCSVTATRSDSGAEICYYDVEGSTSCSAATTSIFSRSSAASTTVEVATTSASVIVSMTSAPTTAQATGSESLNPTPSTTESAASRGRVAVGGAAIIAAALAMLQS